MNSSSSDVLFAFVLHSVGSFRSVLSSCLSSFLLELNGSHLSNPLLLSYLRFVSKLEELCIRN